MGSVAHEEIPPEPAPRDLDAELAGLIDRIGGLVMQLAGTPGCRRAVDELVLTQAQVTDLKSTMADAAASSAVRDAAFAAGRAVERAAIAEERRVPKGHRAPSRKFGLRVVEGIAIATGSLGAALRHSWHAHAPSLAKVALARSLAHPVLTAAGVGTAMGLATGAVVVPNATLTHHFGASALPASVPGWQGSAEPIPGAWQIIAGLRAPSVGPGLDGKSSGSSGATGPGSLAPLGPVPPSYVPASSWPSQSSQQQAQGQPAQQGAGSLQITPTTTSLDLSSGVGIITVTLTPSGDSGWARWEVDTTGSDLQFSSAHGILTATSEPVTFTVSLASVLDAALSQTFTVAGQTFTVGLPGPPPVPTISPSPLDSILPTDPPSSSGD